MHFSFNRNKKLLFEGKKHSEDNKDKWKDVVPTEGLCLEHRDDDDSEHGQWNGFLDDFQLNKVEWASVLHGSDAVGWNHKRIFEQGDAPRHQDDQKQWPVFRRGNDFEQFQLSVPCKSHEDIWNDE